MSIIQLDIHQVRLISSARLTLHSRCNVFFGENGSGKTSLLESIYLLSNGHSFRTREIGALISQEKEALTVFAKMLSGDALSIQKSRQGTFVRLNQQPCLRRSELASFLPCQVFYQDIFDIMDAGPSVRRSLLDWGLFHVEQSYHTLWKDYRRVLKQRNALLRQKADYASFVPWDKQLVELSEALHVLRQRYCDAWFALFETTLQALTYFSCTLSYDKGWDKRGTGKSLAIILREQFEMDVSRQFTHSGAHQADILFDSAQLKAKQALSRGQQKIVLIALKLAQAQILDTFCVYLFDDITLELDHKHIDSFFDFLTHIKGQFFFTTIEPDALQKKTHFSDAAFFSVNNGQFTF